jgi:hypothetical protein
MHQAARHLHQSRHQAAKSWSERDTAHNEEADLSQINCATSLATKAEWAAGNNNRSLQSQWVLGAEGDGKVNGEGIYALARLSDHLRGSARARRGHLCALTRGHLCTTLGCRTRCVYGWTFATEAHLTGARCNGAATAGTNATANLVCQQRLEPRRTIAGGRGACACRLATCRRAIGGAASKRSGRRGGADLRAPCHDHLICPRQVLGE